MKKIRIVYMIAKHKVVGGVLREVEDYPISQELFNALKRLRV